MEHIVVGSLFVVIIVVAGWLVYFYSNMTNKKTLVENSWQLLNAQIQRRNVVLKKYLDTIPQLSKTKKEYLNQFIEASSSCLNAQMFYDVVRLSLEINKFIENLKTENEFHLQADDNINRQLSEVEMSIEKYQELYNKKVYNYNMFLSQFPNNIACGILGVQKLASLDGISQEK